MTAAQMQCLAKRLAAARESGQPIDNLDESCVPIDRQAAYATQDALVATIGEAVGGWKVGAGTGPDPLSAPILASAVYPAESGRVIVEPLANKIEAELAVAIAADLRPRDLPYDRQEVAAAIGSLHPALEVMAGRFRLPVVPPLLYIADLQKSAAVLVGSGQTEWRQTDLARLRISLRIGHSIKDVSTGPSAEELIDAVVWLANNRARVHGGLSKGQVVITGSRVSGPLTGSGETVAADFGPIGTIETVLYLG